MENKNEKPKIDFEVFVMSYKDKTPEAVKVEVESLLTKIHAGGNEILNVRQIGDIMDVYITRKLDLTAEEEKPEKAEEGNFPSGAFGDFLRTMMAKAPPGLQAALMRVGPNGIELLGNDASEPESLQPSEDALNMIIEPVRKGLRGLSEFESNRVLPSLLDQVTKSVPVNKIRALSEEFELLWKDHEKTCSNKTPGKETCIFTPLFQNISKILQEKAKLNTQ